MIDIKLPIKELGLNTRALHWLKAEANIKTIEDLILHESMLLKYPNIGNVTNDHIKEKLAIHNLYLKTDRKFLKKEKKEMTDSRPYVTYQIWFPCESCGKQITHLTMHTCLPQLKITMNPDILPTLEEWRLICKMVKQKQTEIESSEAYLKTREIKASDDEINKLKKIIVRLRKDIENPSQDVIENILKKNGYSELTFSEIEKIASLHLTAHAEFIGAGECHVEGAIDFAKAILKKAREK